MQRGLRRVYGVTFMVNFTVREIEEKDNPDVERIIRTCLIEFGGNREGTAWTDPDLGRFSQVYSAPQSRYWVACSEEGRAIAGVGIAALGGKNGVCELQKMYCLPRFRGTGAANALIETALEFAKRYYEKCYLETLPNMTAAQRFYEKYGFVRIREPLIATGHFACDVCYLKKL